MAAGKPAVRVKGAAEFRAAMKRMGADLSDLTAINRQAAETVAGTARDKAPRLTGALESSIRAGATRTRGTVKAGSRAIPYAGVIHFGWPAHNISPQPFIYDALDERVDLIELPPEVGLLHGKSVHYATPFLVGVLIVFQDVVVIQVRLAAVVQRPVAKLVQQRVEMLRLEVDSGAFVDQVAQQ